jgi:hypothetical protein
MNRAITNDTCVSLAALCRVDGALVEAMRTPAGRARLITLAAGTVIAGSLAYGFVFGLWRSPMQGAYAALKTPALLFSVILASGLLNTLFAQLLGARFSLGEVCLLMLIGMAIAASLMAAMAPIVLFFVLQAPPPDPGIVGLPTADPAAAHSMAVFHILLLMHVAVIGFAGLAGNWQLYRLLRALLPTPRLAARLLAIWIAVSGFVGCELSWLFSPFLCKPNFQPHVFAQTYFEGNFYEHVWHAARAMLRQ